MKQNYLLNKTFCLTVFLLLGMLFTAPSNVNAQQFLNENFDYAVEADLYGNGDWMKYGSNSVSPIKVIDSPLTYVGYQDKAAGAAIELTDASSGQDLLKKFTTGDEHITTGAIYYSALIQVKAAGADNVYFMALVNKTKAGDVIDGRAGSEYARLFVSAASEGKFKVGINRSAANPLEATGEYELNKTYLMVVKYEFVEGITNDKVSLFINPTSFDKEPTPLVEYGDDAVDGDVSTSNGIQAIECRQGGSGSRKASNVLIDAVRVARSYPELFGGEAPAPTPAITLSKKSVTFGNVFVGETYTQQINVKGAHLEGDITLSGLTIDGITSSVTTIAKADAEKAGGVDVTLTLKPKSLGIYEDKLLLESKGASQMSVSFYWTSSALEDIADLKTFSTKNKDDGGNYRYTGSAVITYIYKEGTKTTYYVQDATGAMPIYDGFGDITTSYSVGNRITGFTGTVEPIAGLNSVIPAGNLLGTVVSADNTVKPAMVTLSALTAATADYAGKLIKIEGITYKNIAEGALFTEELVSPAITDGTADGRMKIFKGTDIINTAIPTEAVTLIGISTSIAAPVIAPRTLSDIVKSSAGEPSLEVLPATVESKTAPLNVATEFATFTIKTNNLPSATSLYMTGAGRNMYSLSVDQIPAGTSETKVVVTYTPTAVGKHFGLFNIDCEGYPVVSENISLNGVCIDPNNLPVISLNPVSLPDFAAKVGQKQEQSVVITTANLPDYGSIKVMGEGEGSFTLSTTSLLKNGTSTLKITFLSRKAGTFTERIEFTALELETIYLTVKGVADGSIVDVPEGDKLPLDMSNPQVLVNETFESTIFNTPFAINNWKNVATVGTRAWWGYDFKTDEVVTNKAAKVTAYDLNVISGQEKPCEMLLVTPPLDFKNSASKMFTFRVMGNLLREDQSDLLELCYIDLLSGKMYVEPVDGFEMPRIPDENNEWMEYHIDLKDSKLADVFFMGFRFKSTRGRENSATYYIDDVSYGRTDLPVLTPSKTQLAFTTVVSTDYETDEITVVGKNTKEPITLTLGGANKSKFTLSTKTLPAAGGSFSLSFHSDELGVHEAYIKLASRGAADVYIPLSANNLKGSGITAIPFDETPNLTIFDITGRIIVQKDQCKSMNEAIIGLPAGTYLMHASSASGVRTVKIVVP